MYRTAIDHKGMTGNEFQDYELYTACRSIRNTDGGNVLKGYRNELVAFWCSYDCRIKAGHQATPYEKEQINNFML